MLTRAEARLYTMYRLDGKTKDEICEDLKIGRDTFRKHWTRAMSKLKKIRAVQENPQYFLAKGQDVLAGEVAVEQYPTVEAELLTSPVRDDMRKGSYVRIMRNLDFEDVETKENEYMETRGMIGKVTEIQNDYVVIDCDVHNGTLSLSLPADELELL